MTTDFETLKSELLANPEVKAAYDEMQPEFDRERLAIRFCKVMTTMREFAQAGLPAFIAPDDMVAFLKAIEEPPKATTPQPEFVTALKPEDFEAFFKALDDPPMATERLREAFRRHAETVVSVDERDVAGASDAPKPDAEAERVPNDDSSK